MKSWCLLIVYPVIFIMLWIIRSVGERKLVLLVNLMIIVCTYYIVCILRSVVVDLVSVSVAGFTSLIWFFSYFILDVQGAWGWANEQVPGKGDSWLFLQFLIDLVTLTMLFSVLFGVNYPDLSLFKWRYYLFHIYCVINAS